MCTPSSLSRWTCSSILGSVTCGAGAFQPWVLCQDPALQAQALSEATTTRSLTPVNRHCEIIAQDKK